MEMTAFTEESEEDAGEGIAADDLFAYGTPPTRSAMKLGVRTRSAGGKSDGKRSGSSKPHRVSSSKALDPSTAVVRQGRNMSAARRESKGRRQKARQQARFFKEIDTTLEALGIGTATDPGVIPAAGSVSGLPPSPVSSMLSLSLAFSSEAQLAALATPTALSSRAGTPPPGFVPPGISATGGVPLGGAGLGFGLGLGGSGGGGIGPAPAAALEGLNRRVASDMSLKSSDVPSGYSTPERRPVIPRTGMGMTAVGLWGSLAGGGEMMHPDEIRHSLAAVVPCVATSGTTQPLLPPSSSAAVSTAVPRAMPSPLTIPSELQPVTVDRHRTVPHVANAAAASTAVLSSDPRQAYYRTASYEAELAPEAAEMEGVGRERTAAAAAGLVPYHPSSIRSGWAGVLMSPPPLSSSAAFGASSGLHAATTTAVAAASTAPATVVEGPPLSSTAASRSYSALEDRDTFRRQLGSVLVGHGLTADELQAHVEEAEERGEELEEEISALADAAVQMEEQMQLHLNSQPPVLHPPSSGALYGGPVDRGQRLSWSKLTDNVSSLDMMYRKVKDVLRKAKPLRSHLAEDPELLPRLHELAIRLLGALVEASSALGRVVCLGLEGLGRECGGGAGEGNQADEEEVRNVGKTVRRLLEALDHVTKKISDELGGKASVEARPLLSRCQAVSLDLASAGIQAAAAAAPALLNSSSLAPHSEGAAQGRSGQAKRLVALWEEAARQTDRIARRYSHKRLVLYGELCDAYENAGLQALEMTRGSAQGPSCSEDGGNNGTTDDMTTEDATSCDDGVEFMSYSSGADSDTGGSGISGGTAAWGGGATGAWGSGGGCGGGGGGGPHHGRRQHGVSESEIKAQEWVPSLLQVLLNRASDAHRTLRNELALVDGVGGCVGGVDGGEEAGGGGGGGTVSVPTSVAAGLDNLGSGSGCLAPAGTSCELSDEQLYELWGLLDEMQQTFAELCIANLRRTVRLCTGGSGPRRLWALESVRDSAESALRFVHTHEHSSMALGDMLDIKEELEDKTQRWLQSTWTDYTNLTRRVVNGLLSVRRQINVRRTVAAGSGPESAGRGSAVIGARRRNLPMAGYGRGWPPPAATGRQQPAGPGGCGPGVGFWARGDAGAAGGSAASPSGRQQPLPPLQMSHHNPVQHQQPLPASPHNTSQQLLQPLHPQKQLAVSATSGSRVSGAVAAVVKGTTVAPSLEGISGGEVVAPVHALAHVTLDPVNTDNNPSATPTAAIPTSSATAVGGKWRNALLTQPPQLSQSPNDAASTSMGAGGGGGSVSRNGRTSIDATGPGRPVQPPAVAPIAGAAGTADAAAETHGKIHTSTSSSRLLGAPGPNSGAQRRVAAAVAAKSAAGRNAGGGRRNAGGGRGHGRPYGRGRSKPEPSPPPPSPPPPPPPPMDSQRELPPGLDPWPRLRPHVVTDAGSVGGTVEDGASEVSATAIAGAATAAPASPHTLSPVLPTLASPRSPAKVQPLPLPPQQQQQQPLGVSWAAVARGSAGGAAPPPPAATGSRPSTAGSSGAGGGGNGAATAAANATRINTLKSPFETGTGAQRAATAAAAGSSVIAVGPAAGIGFISSPFKALAEQQSASSPHWSPRPSAPPSPNIRHGGATVSAAVSPVTRQKPQLWLTVPSATAQRAAPHSPGCTDKSSPGVGGGGGSGGGGESSSFQFITGTTGPRSSGGGGGSSSGGIVAAVATINGSSSINSPMGRSDTNSGSGGHWTPRLSSPNSSGPVMPAAAIRPLAGTAAAVVANGNGNGPHHNGHAAKGINQNFHNHQNGSTAVAHHHHHHHHQQTGPVVSAFCNASTILAADVVGTANGSAAPLPGGGGGTMQTALSLSTALSLGLDGIAMMRCESLQAYDSLGSRGGGAGGGVAHQEDISLLADPEVAELFRSIAKDPFWDIRWKDLSHSLTHGLSNMVGSGSIGQVFAGMYLHGEVAIKVIGINREMRYDLRALRAFKHEVDLNKRLNQHPNIVRFIGVCAEYIHHAARQAGLLGDATAAEATEGSALTAAVAAAAASSSAPSNSRPGGTSGLPGASNAAASNQPMLAIVMEYCRMGTLYSMIGAAHQAYRCQKRKGHAADFLRRWSRRLEVLKGAAAGLEYMHRCSVIHHDFTSYNLLLEEKDGHWNTKVCDFNLSRVMARGSAGAALTVPNSGNFCSPRWQSPEYLAGHDYSWATDVFSFAVVIWEVVTLQRPWENELQDARYEPVAMHKMYADGKRLVFPDLSEIRPQLSVLPELVGLCQACWRDDPKERPNMREVADKLMRLHKRVQDQERKAAEAAWAAKGQQGGAAPAAPLPPLPPLPPAAAAAAAAALATPAPNAAVSGAVTTASDSLADLGAQRQGPQERLAAVAPLAHTPQTAPPLTSAATGTMPPTPTTPAPCPSRTPASPFASASVITRPMPHHIPDPSPETTPRLVISPGAAPAPRPARVSPFLTAQQNTDG